MFGLDFAYKELSKDKEMNKLHRIWVYDDRIYNINGWTKKICQITHG